MGTTKNLTPDETLRDVFGTNTRAMVKRILDTYAQADSAIRDSGIAWYAIAESHCDTLSTNHGISREAAAAVIAHLSPRTSWARNVAGAYALCANATAQGCMQANVTRALEALGSSDPLATLKGPKTSAFAANILGDYSRVTVDVWAMRIALPAGTEKATMEKGIGRKGVYSAIARAYTIAAHRAGIEPAVMQAITWIVVRNGRAN